MRFLLMSAVAFAGLSTLAADMTGDADAGKAKATVCGACHGADGNSINSEWPNLAGQHANYTVARLNGYKSGETKDPVMGAQAAGLSKQDIHDLAAYFATLSVKPGEANPEMVDLGAQLYRLGNDETNVASCAACHGPKGRGNPVAMMPAIAGQRFNYTINQLNAFANGTRYGGINNMMHDVAKAMSTEEIEAVASFLEGLH